MLNQTGQEPEDCRPLSEIFGRIGERWTVLVVGVLGGGPQRFNRIRRAVVGITQRMLTRTLRGLERDGLVRRTQYPTNPPAVEYELTARGRSMFEPLAALARWARAHRPGIERSRAAFDQERSVEPTGRPPAAGADASPPRT